jgi:aminotransferase
VSGKRPGSARLAGLLPSEIRRMTRECERVGGINLSQGVCAVASPECVLEAAADAVRRGPQHYTKSEGLPELRAAVAAKLRRDNAIEVDPEREIVVTPGVTGGYLAAIHGLLDPGDGILIPEPFYPYHVNIARAAGLAPHFLRLSPPHQRLDEERLRAALRRETRAIVLCTPSNPAGKVFDREELEAVERVAQERDLLVITDEIYEYFVYDGRRHVSPGSLPGLRPRTLGLFGPAKIFAITGWRIGYAAAPEPLAHALLRASDLFFICAARPLQRAVAQALAELTPEWYQRRAREFEGRRDRLCAALRDAGCEPLVPQGSYYVLADVGALGFATGGEAAMALLEKAGVATVPGTSFTGDAAGERSVRACFAVEDDVLDEACARLRAFGRASARARELR